MRLFPLRSAALFALLLFTPAFAAEPAAAPKKKQVVCGAKCQEKKQAALEAKQQKELAAKIDAILAEPEVSRGFWGVLVVDKKTGKTLYETNADRLFTPASNTKLYTTVAAMSLLGPDFRYRTTVETAGNITADGKLIGNIVLVGRGDTTMSGAVYPYNLKLERQTPHLKVLSDLADQVAKAGVKEIEGDVIGDDSYFAFERFGEGWAADDLMWGYGAPISALTVNENVVYLSVLPGAVEGEKAQLKFDPDVNYFEVENNIKTVDAGSKRDISIDREPNSRKVYLWGAIPLGDKGQNEALAVDDPADFASLAFKQMLEQRGIRVKGNNTVAHLRRSALPLTSTDNGVAYGGGTSVVPPSPARMVLATRDSVPLWQDVRLILKISQNLHAEITYRTLSAKPGTTGTAELSSEAMKNFLLGIGVKPEEFAIYDGSGLSRMNLITPRATVKLLQFASQQSWFPQFKDGLPVAGVDGTLANRMKGTPAEAHVFAKTGTLGGTNALGGFISTLEGRDLIFSAMGNHHKLRTKGGEAILDRIVQTIVDDRPAPEPPKPARRRVVKKARKQ